MSAIDELRVMAYLGILREMLQYAHGDMFELLADEILRVQMSRRGYNGIFSLTL